MIAGSWFTSKRELFYGHSLADLHMQNKRIFAEHADVELHRCEEEIEGKLKIPLGNHFNKERCLLYYLQNSPDNIEWVLWVDGDTWFYNQEARPLDLINIVRERYRRGGKNPTEPWPHIIMTQDWKGLNAGIMLVRVSNYSVSFFKEVVSKDRGYSDQKVIKNVLQDRNDTDGYKIIVLPYNDHWKLQTYNPVYTDWLVHTPKCDDKGEENCLRVQLVHYCLNPMEPKFQDLEQRCKDLKRKLAYSHSFAWMRGGMFGWFLYLNPKWSLARLFIEEWQENLTHWDNKYGYFKQGPRRGNLPW